ncbi:hypothetical protein Tco_1539553 [Tanacetum coccineum]
MNSSDSLESGGDDNHDEFADLYIIKWSSLMDDTTNCDYDGKSHCDSGWGEQDCFQSKTAVESVVGWGVLQLLGVGSLVSVRERAHRTKRKDTNDCFCLGWADCKHDFVACGYYTST